MAYYGNDEDYDDEDYDDDNDDEDYEDDNDYEDNQNSSQSNNEDDDKKKKSDSSGKFGELKETLNQLSEVKGVLDEFNQKSATEKMAFLTMYKLIEGRLEKAKQRVSNPFECVTKLTFAQNWALKKAKTQEYSKYFRKIVKDIENKLRANRARAYAPKIMSASPLLFYIAIGALFIFLIIVVVATLGSAFSWLFPSDDGDGGANSAFGVTGDDFYGVRMVYTDNEKATQSIVEDYVEFVEIGILEAVQTTTISAGGSDYNVTLNINHIAMPGEDYDYSTFNESNFYSNYAKLHEIILNIAKETYKVDNGSEYSGTFLIECVDGIKYFGFGDMSTIAPAVAEEIVTIESITAKDSGGNTITDSTTLGLIEDAVEEKLVENYTSNQAYSIRAEKLFVKDYILVGDDARVSGVTSEKYVQMIFMAKKDVTFTGFSFAVGNADLSNFEISMEGVNLTTDGNNLGNNEKQSYIYGSGTVNVSANTFTDIDVNNLNALADGLSLFDIVENQGLNNSTYLETKTSENSVEYLSLKKNGVVVEMKNDEAFSFVEYETAWKSAS